MFEPYFHILAGQYRSSGERLEAGQLVSLNNSGTVIPCSPNTDPIGFVANQTDFGDGATVCVFTNGGEFKIDYDSIENPPNEIQVGTYLVPGENGKLRVDNGITIPCAVVLQPSVPFSGSNIAGVQIRMLDGYRRPARSFETFAPPPFFEPVDVHRPYVPKEVEPDPEPVERAYLFNEE